MYIQDSVIDVILAVQINYKWHPNPEYGIGCHLCLIRGLDALCGEIANLFL